MNAKATQSRKPRARHSFRERIYQVILDRKARGDTLVARDIIDEAGGGSFDTVREELARMAEPTIATMVGLGSKTPAQRIAVLENAVNEISAREQVLAAENKILKDSLQTARADVDKLLGEHQHSQRLLLQGVDDLRQLVKAGQGALPKMGVEHERPKATAPESGEAILWKARHDQLLQRFLALEAKCRKQASQLFELGVDVD